MVLATLVAFEPVRHNDFVSFDDRLYLTGNPEVRQGLSAGGVVWAFTTTHATNWHPLTWLSHMLDVELFGMEPAAHHAANVILHAGAALLLLLFLERATGALWPSAFAAALFAVHPLRVESVAWAAERKDVLAALFWMATLLVYRAWTVQPSNGRYAGLVAVYALGLASKPMGVTLPFALLLLDFWPLGRLERTTELWPRVREKAPLFALAAASCAITLYAQRSNLALEPWTGWELGAGERIANAALAYVTYLRQTLWPQGLAILYPHRGVGLLAPATLLALGLLAAGTGAVLAARRERYLAVGWLWFLGTLVPVIGIVQVGFQAMADRYTYVPSLGLCVMVAFGSAALVRRFALPIAAAAPLAAVAILALAGATREQVAHWRDSETLYARALAVHERNAVAHTHLAGLRAERGDRAGAVRHLRRALEIAPGFVQAHYNLGVELEAAGRTDAAIEHYRRALESHPSFAYAHYNLANLLGRRGALDEAIHHYERTLDALPSYAGARYGLGVALMMQGRDDDAARAFEAAGRFPPGWDRRARPDR